MVRSPPRRQSRTRVERLRSPRPRSPRPRSPIRGKGGPPRHLSPRRHGGGPRHGRPRSPLHLRGGGGGRGTKKRKGRRNRGRRPNEGVPLSGGNSMPVASMRMRMDDYAPPRARRLLPRLDMKKAVHHETGVGVDQTLARARREATTRTKDTFWTKKLLDAEDGQPNRWVHSGFKELYREELGYSDQGDLSPDEKEKGGRVSSKSGDPRPTSRSKGSPRNRGSSKSKDNRGSQTREPRGSPRPKDPRLTVQRKGVSGGSPRGRSQSPRDPRRRSRSRSPLRTGASLSGRGRRGRARSYSVSSYTSSSSRTSSSRSYSGSYSSYSRSTSSSGSSYTSSSSSRSRRSYPHSPSPPRRMGGSRRAPPPPGSPPVGGQVRVKHKETTKKFVTKTTVTRSVQPPAVVGLSGPVAKLSKTRLKKEGGAKKSSHRAPPISLGDPVDPGGFYDEPPPGPPVNDGVAYSPASPRPIGGHLLDPHHYQVVPPNHPEYHRGRPRETDDEDSQSSGTSEDEGPRKLTLSERFGKLAQLSSQRQEYDGVRMRIVREGGQDKKVYLEDGRGASPSSTGSVTHHRHPRAHERWLEEHQAEFREYRRRYGEIRNWDPHRDLPRELPPDWDDVHVRHRYYKESGYFGDRSISLEDYLKWEEWWYRYRDWLEKYGDKQDWQYSSGGDYESEARAGQTVSSRWPSREVSRGESDDRKRRRY